MRLDELPGVGLLDGFLARGDAELPVDGFDVRLYGARGHVEELAELRDGQLGVQEAQHCELTLGKLPIHRSDGPARPALSEFALLGLEKFGEDARVRVKF